jgi:hypothetical protein
VLPGIGGNIEGLLEKSRLFRSRPRKRYVKAQFDRSSTRGCELRPPSSQLAPDVSYPAGRMGYNLAKVDLTEEQ